MVSIIMPTYNRAYIIEKAIQSVQRQTYEDWELIIVDDASADGTRQLLQVYAGPKIRCYFNASNQGANASRNLGAAYARGELLAFLDSDNDWPDDRLEVQVRMAERHWGKRCFFYGRAQITSGDDVRIVPETILSSEELKERELRRNEIDTNTVLIRRELFLEAGGFCRELPRLQDWELILRLLFHYGMEAVACEEILSFNTVQKDSISKDGRAYLTAIGFLVRKYFNARLPAQEVMDHLYRACRCAPSEQALARRTIEEACADNPLIFPEAVHRLCSVAGCCKDMEELLCMWHVKSMADKGKTIFSRCFLLGGDVRNIAIYGLGRLGKLFYDEIKCLPVAVRYGIDIEKQSFDGLQVRRPDEALDGVDLIVVALFEEAEEVRRGLRQRFQGKIVTLKELIQSI